MQVRHNSKTMFIHQKLSIMINHKYQLIALVWLCLASFTALAQSDKNYVRSHQVQVSGITDSNTDMNVKPNTEVLTTTQYFDGLGRPIQTVQKKASQSGLDMVQHIEYDAFGRQQFSHLPFTQGSDGQFKDNAPTQQQGFLQYPFLSGSR